MENLGQPTASDVLERGRVVDREADEDDGGVRVGKRSERVVLLPASGVPEAEGDGLVAEDHLLIMGPVDLRRPLSVRPDRYRVLQYRGQRETGDIH